SGQVITPEKQYIYGYKDLSFEEFCSYIYWRTKIREANKSTLSNTPKSFMYLYLFELCNFTEYSLVEEVVQTLMWLLEHAETHLLQIIKDAVYEFVLLYVDTNLNDSWIFTAYSDRFDHVMRANSILNGDLSGMLDYITPYSTRSSIFADYEHLINKIFPIVIIQANQYLEQKGISFLELWLGKIELQPMRLRFIKERNKDKLQSKEVSRFGTVFISVTQEGISELSWVSLGQQRDPGQCIFARSYVMKSFYSLFEIELRKILGQRSIKPKMEDMERMSSHSSILMKLYQEFKSTAFRECLSNAIKRAI
ncbi:MAG: TerB N-terminal domain-containing protein, partial [Erysipelotrichaceae bacterium]|nr:TerB N-terminal domain-containing protein [Erysipelotrichaceae bacterium]